jgi:hypothetical protein
MRLDRIPWHNNTPVLQRQFLLLLDEIDIHLHPAWQRKVLPLVQRPSAAKSFANWWRSDLGLGPSGTFADSGERDDPHVFPQNRRAVERMTS